MPVRAPVHALPLGIYVHFPWCLSRCPYCDFNAHAAPADAIPQQQYLQRMQAEIRHAQPLVAAAAESLFFGGGTPSLLAPQAVAALVSDCRQHLRLLPEAEVTLEVNPGAVESGVPADWLDAGVNRLSLGVQSFDDDSLAAIGRIHSAAEADSAIASALAAGFQRLNVDLMYGLPGQTRDMALADLESAIASGVGHISWYQLTLEPNTPFWSAPPDLPDEDGLQRMEGDGAALLESAGFERYEVSAWAKGEQQCRHNLNYWTFGDYLGMGPGAHSKMSFGAESGSWAVRRWSQLRHPASWLAAVPGASNRETRTLSEDALGFEFFLNALRLYPGVADDLLYERAGLRVDADPIASCLVRAREQGLLRQDSLLPTDLGRRHLDSLSEIFLLEDVHDADDTHDVIKGGSAVNSRRFGGQCGPTPLSED